jgi:hypothetical protein
MAVIGDDSLDPVAEPLAGLTTVPLSKDPIPTFIFWFRDSIFL